MGQGTINKGQSTAAEYQLLESREHIVLILVSQFLMIIARSGLLKFSVHVARVKIRLCSTHLREEFHFSVRDSMPGPSSHFML